MANPLSQQHNPSLERVGPPPEVSARVIEFKVRPFGSPAAADSLRVPILVGWSNFSIGSMAQREAKFDWPSDQFLGDHVHWPFR